MGLDMKWITENLVELDSGTYTVKFYVTNNYLNFMPYIIVIGCNHLHYSLPCYLQAELFINIEFKKMWSIYDENKVGE